MIIGSQMPMTPQAQDVFTIVAPDGLYTPTRVRQGASNATPYFNSVLTRLLRVWKRKTLVDDVFVHINGLGEFFENLDEILARLKCVGVFSMVHKCS